jgi:hypothetical protein
MQALLNGADKDALSATSISDIVQREVDLLACPLTPLEEETIRPGPACPLRPEPSPWILVPPL